MSKSLVPDTYWCKLRYTSRNLFTTVGGAVFHYVWNGNNVFDPDLTGTGSQPVGLDQLATMYKTYCVFASRIKLIYIGGITTIGGAAELSVCPTVTASDFALIDPQTVKANPKASWRICGDRQTGPYTMSKYQTTKGMMGQAVAQDDVFRAVVGAPPANGWFWHINGQCIDEATDINVILYTELVYYVRFTQRVALNLS